MQGAYDPNAEETSALLAAQQALSSANSSSASSRRKRRAVSGLSYRGMTNPTICLKHGSHMMWKVSNTDFPKYDKSNLYNTNPSFDDGPFKALEEKHQLESTKFELFAYRFDTEGVYVFTSSANPESTMVSCVWLESDCIFCQCNSKTRCQDRLHLTGISSLRRTKRFIFLVVRQNGWLDLCRQR